MSKPLAPDPALRDPRCEIQMLSRAAAAKKTGLSATQLARLEVQGLFPSRVRLSPRRSGYVLDEVEGWLRARLQTRHDGTYEDDPVLRAEPGL